MPEIASMCVSLENESERATVIKYIFFNCFFSVLPKFYVKTNKRQVKIDKFIKCPGWLFEALRYVHKNIHSCRNKRSKSLLKGSQSNK